MRANVLPSVMLESLIEEHDYLYCVEHAPIISDTEFDELVSAYHERHGKDGRFAQKIGMWSAHRIEAYRTRRANGRVYEDKITRLTKERDDLQKRLDGLIESADKALFAADWGLLGEDISAARGKKCAGCGHFSAGSDGYCHGCSPTANGSG